MRIPILMALLVSAVLAVAVGPPIVHAKHCGELQGYIDQGNDIPTDNDPYNPATRLCSEGASLGCTSFPCQFPPNWAVPAPAISCPKYKIINASAFGYERCPESTANEGCCELDKKDQTADVYVCHWSDPDATAECVRSTTITIKFEYWKHLGPCEEPDCPPNP